MEQPSGNIKIIESTDPLNSKVIDLRNEVLKKPLGLKCISQEDVAEENFIIFVYQEGDEVTGCAHLQPEINKFRLRQMGVASGQRGKNIGRQLVEATFEYAKKQDAPEMYVYGKMGSHGFYQKCGFEIVPTEDIVHFGIHCYLLRKLLK